VIPSALSLKQTLPPTAAARRGPRFDRASHCESEANGTEARKVAPLR
jgi:hypothetical protein